MTRSVRATFSLRNLGSTRLLAALTGFALAMSLVPTAWATSTDRITARDGDSIVVDDDVEREGENERGILATNKASTEVPTTVDVSGYLSVSGSYQSIGADLEALSGCETEVSVGGDVSASSPHTTQGITQYTYKGSTEIHVGGDVEATIEGQTKYDEHSSIGLQASVHGNNSTSIADVKGSVRSTSYLDNSHVDGAIVNASEGGSLTATVGGDIIADATEDGSSVTGIITLNDGGKIDLDVGGSVVASHPSQDAIGLDIGDDGLAEGKQSNTVVHIHGDVISDGTGMMLKAGNESAHYEIVIEGILQTAKTPILIVRSRPAIELVVGGISTPSNDIALELDEDTWEYRPTEKSRAFAAAINYIVHIDANDVATKQLPGGTVSVFARDGSPLKVLGEHNVAHANDVILVRVTPDEGYVVDSVFNGEGDERVELAPDGEGNYLLEIPTSGTINLSALFKQAEPTPEPTPEPEPQPTPSDEPSPALPTSPAQKALPATGDADMSWVVPLAALGGALVLAGAGLRLGSAGRETA